MSDTPVTTVEKDYSKRNSVLAGVFLALVGVSIYSLFGLFNIITVAAPYFAGVGMFVGLLAIFAAIIGTLKAVRKSTRKETAIWDCYIAIATIGTLGYFLAACVATFQPGSNPAELWTNGGMAALCFAALFGGGKYVGELLAEGKKNGGK